MPTPTLDSASDNMPPCPDEATDEPSHETDQHSMPRLLYDAQNAAATLWARCYGASQRSISFLFQATKAPRSDFSLSTLSAMAESSASVTSDTAAENGPGWSDRPRRKLSVEAIAITGCVVAFLSLIVTIVALLPSFKGEELAIAQLKLAVWTASNEYLQQCKDQSV